MRSLVVVPIRVIVAAAGVATAAQSLGAGRAATTAAVAAVVVLFLLLARESRRPGLERFSEAGAPPPGARDESLWEALRVAVFPSTVGLTALTAIALVVDAGLAAFMAGLLVGAAAFSLAVGLQVLRYERANGVELLVLRGEPYTRVSGRRSR
jgi:hypothetical protein